MKYITFADYGLKHSGNDPAIGNDSSRAAELVRLLEDARLYGSVLPISLAHEMLSCNFRIEDDLLPPGFFEAWWNYFNSPLQRKHKDKRVSLNSRCSGWIR